MPPVLRFVVGAAFNGGAISLDFFDSLAFMPVRWHWPDRPARLLGLRMTFLMFGAAPLLIGLIAVVGRRSGHAVRGSIKMSSQGAVGEERPDEVAIKGDPVGQALHAEMKWARKGNIAAMELGRGRHQFRRAAMLKQRTQHHEQHTDRDDQQRQHEDELGTDSDDRYLRIPGLVDEYMNEEGAPTA